MCPLPATHAASDAKPRYAAFEFRAAAIHARTISLEYALTGGPDAEVIFTETLELPATLAAPDPADPTVCLLLEGIHRAFGVSYYKSAVPDRVIAGPVGDLDADFWDFLYTEGLGEFYYTNQLQPSPDLRFPRGVSPPKSSPARRAPSERALVLVGGGKDSAVVREIVRHAGVEATAFSLGVSPWIARSVAAMGLPHLVVRRTIDPKLKEMNRRGAYNGHVPISACIAAVATFVAHLGDYGYVIAGNERSADERNLMWGALSVNHQWSKSLAFEEQFGAWCERRVAAGPRYFSLLRTLSELRIAEAFASHPGYFDHFASCNANFRQILAGNEARWCGRCPKCVFVYLMLAPFIDPRTLAAIFPDDLLEDPANRPLLERLTGVAGFKPFECVGTAEESRAALVKLDQQGRIPAALRPWYERQVLPRVADAAALLREIRTPAGRHRIPPQWERRLHAYLAARES